MPAQYAFGHSCPRPPARATAWVPRGPAGRPSGAAISAPSGVAGRYACGGAGSGHGPAATDAVDRPDKPERLVQTGVATMQNSREFGPLVAGEGRRAFYEAPRQAFVGDGQKYNWQIQRAWFPHFVAITDFLHVLCYLYRAAWAVGADDATRWRQFEGWMTACWQGRVAQVLAELAAGRSGWAGRRRGKSWRPRTCA